MLPFSASPSVCLSVYQALSLKDAKMKLLREEVARAVQELEQVRREAQSQQARAEVNLLLQGALLPACFSLPQGPSLPA